MRRQSKPINIEQQLINITHGYNTRVALTIVPWLQRAFTEVVQCGDVFLSELYLLVSGWVCVLQYDKTISVVTTEIYNNQNIQLIVGWVSRTGSPDGFYLFIFNIFLKLT